MITVTILIHELGHMFFGILSGYSFLHIKVYGFCFERINSRYRIRYYKEDISLGQCMMYPGINTDNPVLFILGGIIFNLIFGMLFIMCSFAAESMIVKIILLLLGGLNIFMSVYNMFFASETSDGKTAQEVLRSPENKRIYNSIMIIAYFLREGRSYAEMPGELFVRNAEKTGCRSSLVSEMNMHTRRFRLENGERKWRYGEAGEPVDEIIMQEFKTGNFRQKRYEKCFEHIILSADKHLFSGEYLCAAKCFMLLAEEKSDIA